MFCTKCGNQFADGSAFCPNCGTPVNAAPQQPVYQQPVQPQYQQPQYQQPQYQQPMYQQPVQPQYQQPQYQQPYRPAPVGGNTDLKKIWHLIVAGVAVLALIIGILSVFGVVDISATVSANGESESGSGSIWDIKEFTMGIIGNVLFGLASIAAAAIGILYFLKVTQNKPFYDQFIGKLLPKFGPGAIMGVLGAAAAVLQVILFLMEGDSQTVFGYTVSVTYWPSWLTWVGLVAYGGLAAVDFLVVNKKQ